MRELRGLTAVAALTCGLASPALAQPMVTANIIDWPNPGAQPYFLSALTRSDHQFFGSAVQDIDFTYYGAIYRLTLPAVAGKHPKTEIIYDFRSLDAPFSGFAPVGKIVVDSEGRLYGLATSPYLQTGPTAFIYMLQPPASGTQTWTLRIIWSGGAEKARNHPGGKGGLLIDRNGSLYGQSFPQYVSGQSCPGDQQSCVGIFKLTPDATRTSWKLSIIDKTLETYSPAFPAMDASGNIFTTSNIPAKKRYAVVEISPPALPGGRWTHNVIWHSKPGQLALPTSVTMGPEGNLIICATGKATGAGGVFKLTRPATSPGSWTYTPVYAAATKEDIGAYPNEAIVDAKGDVFVKGAYDLIRATPPAHLGQLFTLSVLVPRPKESRPDPLGELATDDEGNILSTEQMSVLEVTDSGFVPQSTGK